MIFINCYHVLKLKAFNLVLFILCVLYIVHVWRISFLSMKHFRGFFVGRGIYIIYLLEVVDLFWVTVEFSEIYKRERFILGINNVKRSLNIGYILSFWYRF